MKPATRLRRPDTVTTNAPAPAQRRGVSPAVAGAAVGAVLLAALAVVLTTSDTGTVGQQAMENPTASWLFEVGGGLVWVGFAVWCVVDTVRHRRLSLRTLVFLSATSMFWLEWPCDWGLYLLWNPDLKTMPFPSMPFDTPNKPWAVLFGYGWFFPVLLPLLLAAVRSVRRRFTGTNPIVVLVAVAGGLAYIYNLLTEPFMTFMGWYSYLDTTGPALHFTKGSFPLLYPPLLLVWFWVIMVHLIDTGDDRGNHRLDVLLGLARRPDGLRKEATRAVAWIVTFNAVFLVFPVGLTVVVRFVFGHDHPFVPWPN